MRDNSAVDELIRRALDPGVSNESLNEAIGAAFSTLAPDDQAGAEAVLRRLAGDVIDAPTRPDVAGTIAVCCGAMVERGLDPTIAINPILDRLETEVAPGAISFVAACRQADEEDERPAPAAAEGGEGGDGGEEDEKPDPIETHGERIAALLPDEGRAFRAIEPFSMAAVAMLARSAASRKASWLRTHLRKALDDLGGQYGHAGFLWMMMQVLDDEPLVVLHPDQAKGYQVRISGLADNFQLHTLVADALIGRFSGQWLRGRRPSRAEVAGAGKGQSGENGAPAHGSFNLWTWRGLTPEGTLRDPLSGAEHWIWNEGVPADIPQFEDTRVVLLGPPPYERSWNVGRRFPAMPGDLRVERVLSGDEVRGFLGGIASAVSDE